MSANRRISFGSTAAALAALLILPAGSAAAEIQPPQLAYDLAALVAPAPAPAADVVKTADADAPDGDATTTAAADPEALSCMAKVVHHEARGQPRAGQVAVAQTLLNRVKAGGRFGGSICAVANQRGQFFDTAAYHPREDSGDWQTALEVSRAAISGTAEPVAPGALFFRAAYARPSSFFRSRQRIATVGGQVFYR